MATISGEIHQFKNKAGTKNWWPRTVTEAIYGLDSTIADVKTWVGNSFVKYSHGIYNPTSAVDLDDQYVAENTIQQISWNFSTYSNVSNRPSSSASAASVLVLPNSWGGLQFYTDYNSNTYYIRNRYSTTGWKSWVQLYHTGNFNPANYLTTSSAASTYVTALGTDGNYLTWTKGGTANNITVPYATTADGANRAFWLNTNNTIAFGKSGLQYFSVYGTEGTSTTANDTPTTAWYHILRMNHGDSDGYFADLAIHLSGSNGIYWRRIAKGANLGWFRILDSNNFASIIGTTTYAPYNSSGYLPLSGGQMTGPLTWKNSTALPENSSAVYFLTIDAFASGGTTKWASADTVKTSLGLANYLPLAAQGTTVYRTTSGQIVDFNNSKGANEEAFFTISSNGTRRNAVGWNTTYGTYIYNYASAKYLGIKADGTPHYQGYTLWHSGNSNLYTVNWVAAVMEASTRIQVTGGTDAKIVLNNTDSETNNQYISFQQNGTQYGYLGTIGDDYLRWSGSGLTVNKLRITTKHSSSSKAGGIYYYDGTTDYLLIGQGSSNLWIGANETSGTHHAGSTYISTGGVANLFASKLVSGTRTNAVILDALNYYAYPAHSLRDYNYHDTSHRRAAGNVTFADGGLHYFLATYLMTDAGRPEHDGQIIQCAWDNGTYDSQLFIPSGGINSDDNAHVKVRGQNGQGSWNSWHTLFDDVNLNMSKIINIMGGSLPEAYLGWGGRNYEGSFGPLDAALVSEFGANRFAFAKSGGIVVEYSTDGGSTWTDYGAGNDSKTALFSNGSSFTTGKNTSTGGGSANNMLRVTLRTGAAQIYTVLYKFVIYCSTQGSSGSYCTIRCRTQQNYENNVDTWVTVADHVSIAGYSGYNVINYPTGVTTYGNRKDSQYGEWQFIFGYTGFSGNSYGLTIYNIWGYGGVGWTTPSTMAKTGHLYSYDSNQVAYFPSSIIPATNGNDLGGTSYRWELYATSGNFTGTWTNGSAGVTINNNTTSAIPWLLDALAPNMSTGTYTAIVHGKANSAYNAASLSFYNAGAGSANNYAGIGLYGHDNLLIVRGDGNVGIGTTSPSVKLQIASSDYSYINTRLSGSAIYLDKLSTNGTGFQHPVVFRRLDASLNVVEQVHLIAAYSTSSYVCTYIAGSANNNSAIRIDGSGTSANVSVGYTGGGSYKLNVNGQTYSSTGFIAPNTYSYNGVDKGGAVRGIMKLDNNLLMIGNGSSAANYPTYIDGGTFIRFRIGTAHGTLATMTSTGLGIANTSPAYTLDVTGTIHSTVGIFSDGYVSALGTASSSDAKLKDDITTISYDRAKAVLSALNPREWTWNALTSKEGERGAGMVAQEVESILPDTVKEIGGNLTLEYNTLFAYGLAMTKYMLPMVETHEEKIARLEKEVEELKRQLTN